MPKNSAIILIDKINNKGVAGEAGVFDTALLNAFLNSPPPSRKLTFEPYTHFDLSKNSYLMGMPAVRDGGMNLANALAANFIVSATVENDGANVKVTVTGTEIASGNKFENSASFQNNADLPRNIESAAAPVIAQIRDAVNAGGKKKKR